MDWGRGVVDAGANAVSNDQYALTPEQQNRANGEQLRANIVGGAEVGLAGAGGLVSLLPQGINTLVGLPLAGVDNTIKTNERIADFFTRTPTTEAGIDIGRGLAETMQPVAEMDASARDWLGNKATIEGLPTEVNGLLYGAGTIVPEIVASMLGIGAMARAFNSASIAPHLKPGFKYEGGVVAGRKAKKLNPDAVALAESMKAGGSSAAEIREATKALGTPIWFDTDGSLRWEIDDSGMIVNRDADGTAFSDRVSHPELFDNYPEAKDIRMNDDWGMGTTGSYDEAMNVISFNSQQPRFDLKKLLAHEVNHGVQGIEGFARGGSPSEFKAYPQSFISEFQTNQMPRLVELEGKANPTNLERHELRKLSRVRDNMVEYAEKSQGGRLSPFDMYQRKLGEADSRAVEDRIGMTKQQRDEVEFNESHDVPAEEITRDYFGGQPSLSDKEKRNGDPIPDKGLLSQDQGFNPRTQPKKQSKAEAMADGWWDNIGAGKKLKIHPDDMRYQMDDTANLAPSVVRTPDDLLGMTGIYTAGDRSRTGGNLLGVNGEDLPFPVAAEGGVDYPRNLDHPYAWASNSSVMGNLEATTQGALGRGTQPVGVFAPMKHKAMDFNTMTTDTTLGLMQRDLSPTSKKLFDAEMRKTIKMAQNQKKPTLKGVQWKGLDDPSSLEMLDNLGDLRHAFMTTVKKDKAQNMKGAPDLPSIRNALTKPELRDLDGSTIGQGLSLLEGGLVKNAPDRHSTYDTSMFGSSFGELDTALPSEEVFPSFYAHRRLMEGDPTKDYRSLEMKKPWQLFDRETIAGMKGQPQTVFEGSSTGERIPFGGGGHLENLHQQPYDVKQAYSDELGDFNPYESFGFDVDKTQKGIGAWSEGGETQYNPVRIEKPLFEGGLLANRDEAIAVENWKGLVNQQAGSPVNVQRRVAPEDANALRFNFRKEPSMKDIENMSLLGAENDMFLSPTGHGNYTLLHANPDEVIAGRDVAIPAIGDGLEKSKNKGFLKGQQSAIVEPVHSSSEYVDLTGELTTRGQGKATQKALDSWEKVMPKVEKMLGDPKQKAYIKNKMVVDAKYARDTGDITREDYNKLYSIMSDPDLSGAGIIKKLREGVKNGGLPAAGFIKLGEEEE